MEGYSLALSGKKGHQKRRKRERRKEEQMEDSEKY